MGNMKHLKGWKRKFPRGRRYRFTRTALAAKEFRFGSAEVGATCTRAAWLTFPFPRSVRDALLAEGLAGQ